MKNNVETLLRSLQRINPDASFVARSKAQILASSQETAPERMSVLTWLSTHQTAKIAIGLASIVIVTTVGISSYVGSNTRSLSRSFNSAALSQEADSLDFQIHIKEAVYYDETAQEMALALDKIAN